VHNQGDTLGLIGNLSGVVRFNHVTAAGNNSPVLYSLPGAGFMEITNSLFADSAQPACRTDAITAQTSSGGNVFRPGSDCPRGPLDVETEAPLLSDRASTAGQSVRVPLPDSPALDLITADCLSQDLLGTPRPVDGDDDGMTGCDAGAIEARPDAVFASAFEA
jgi:hypothetical protein